MLGSSSETIRSNILNLLNIDLITTIITQKKRNHSSMMCCCGGGKQVLPKKKSNLSLWTRSSDLQTTSIVYAHTHTCSTALASLHDDTHLAIDSLTASTYIYDCLAHCQVHTS